MAARKGRRLQHADGSGSWPRRKNFQWDGHRASVSAPRSPRTALAAERASVVDRAS
eukprot:CAMPEP_0184401874 /NCGR_PEP_ID=MMETSP0007-20130409/80732_1 /TAXON_ID=97485 /ORGANISM="Prymnesium parvum, Strain Texoma1" /LENGTH=55 /DNA_ID=CAMNT_0026757445 /DNA_START=24 /DNA_END=191 /DNA_ORIENTATION=+